jgi:phosphatidylglycerophosphate synthase
MMSPKERVLQQIGMWMHRWFGITPNGLSLMRIFCTPWITLLIIETIRTMSAVYAVCALALYVFAILTDLFDGPLARALVAQGTVSHDVGYGGALDRISDKLIIVFSLVPFGFNVFITAIILGESILLYQALHATTTKKKQATYVGEDKDDITDNTHATASCEHVHPHAYVFCEWVYGSCGVIYVSFCYVALQKEVPVQ